MEGEHASFLIAYLLRHNAPQKLHMRDQDDWVGNQVIGWVTKGCRCPLVTALANVVTLRM